MWHHAFRAEGQMTWTDSTKVVALLVLVITGCGSSSPGGAASSDAGTGPSDAAKHPSDASHDHPDARPDAPRHPPSKSDAVGSSDLSIFVVPNDVTDLAGSAFYDHPWPSDYRLDASGNVLFTGFDNPKNEPILTSYLTAVAGTIHGFSIAAFGYMRFATDLDPTTLPATPPDTLSASSTVQIINVDPSSPEHDQRHLAEVYYREAAGVYWQTDTLAVGPALGYPLLPNTKYAIVVTRDLKAKDGAPIGPSADLSAVLGLTATNATNKPVHDLFAAALADVVALGIPASTIAHFTSFTTNDPAALLFSMADALPSLTPAPTVLTNAAAGEDAGAAGVSSLVSDPGDIETGIYDVYRGWYGPAPNYQEGTPPYLSGGGGFVFDGQGNAVVQNTFPMRFTLVVPNATACPMPPSGYPILMYAHGTGGSNLSVIDEGGSVGDAMARQCVASIGTDELFQGVRPGAPAPGDPNTENEDDLNFYNVANPAAFRANTIQSALDVVHEARLFTETNMSVPGAASATGAEITFDSTKLLFMGHSEGSLNGPLYMAADSSARGGVLSGASADVSITLLDKTSPSPSVAGLFLVGVGLTGPAAAEMNTFHPVLSFAQTAMDRIDPLVYQRYLVESPRPGHAPKSLYQTEGVNPDGTGDTYAPPPGIEVGSVAMGLPSQAPLIHPIVEEPWGGIPSVTVGDAGLSGNLADGAASGILAQFLPAPGFDGHFVFFEVPQCRLQAAQFVANLAANPNGRVPPLSQ
jgi:hypothetical protein